MAIDHFFRFECAPSAVVRIDDIKAFLDLMKKAFAVKYWEERFSDKRLEDRKNLEELLNRERDSDGISFTMKGLVADGRIIVNGAIAYKSLPFFFGVVLNETSVRPRLDVFKEAIALLIPFDAAVTVQSFARLFHLTDRLNKLRSVNSYKPVFVHWYQYWNAELIDMIGGIDHVLRTPAYRTERFLDGVLIQLTEKWFDPDDPEHVAIHRQAMIHLGMDPDWQPPPAPRVPGFKTS